MSNYLTPSYFTGEVLIPNLTETTQGAYLIKNLYQIISIKEPEFLRMLLGQDLYEDFVAGLAATPVLAKWTALKAQIYYTANVKSGPSDMTGTTVYLSPAANYVWFYFTKQNSSISTNIGDAKPESQSVKYDMDRGKLIAVWNSMVKMVDDIREWMGEHSSDYTNYQDTGYLQMMTIWDS